MGHLALPNLLRHYSPPPAPRFLPPPSLRDSPKELAGSRIRVRKRSECIVSVRFPSVGFIKRRFSDNFTIRALPEEELMVSNGYRRILVASVVTVTLAVANRVLYKLALVPMARYPFFMAQMTTFGYLGVYFSILFIRSRAGIVTDEMLKFPKYRFMAIGFLEALGVAAGMSAGAMLPGPAIPILSQTFLVWQLCLSVIILGRKYSLNQIFGCLFVAAGVIMAVASGANNGQLLSQISFVWPALMIASAAFQAGASILKESVFIDAARRLKKPPLDIFVVNSYGSSFQALFVFLLLPILSNMRGIRFHELPGYLTSGAACFLNLNSKIAGCEGAPLLPLLFMSVNIGFNISLLHLLRTSSAVVASLLTTLSVPVSIYILTLPLPWIPKGPRLTPFFIVGTAVLVLGLLLYNLPTHRIKEKSDV